MNKALEKQHSGNQNQMLMAKILEAINSIKYGCVQIIIQDSEVVQIEKTEKIRVRRPRDGVCK